MLNLGEVATIAERFGMDYIQISVRRYSVPESHEMLQENEAAYGDINSLRHGPPLGNRSRLNQRSERFVNYRNLLAPGRFLKAPLRASLGVYSLACYQEAQAQPHCP